MIDGVTLEKINNLNLPNIQENNSHELNLIYDNLINQLTSDPYCEIRELYDAIKDRIDYLVNIIKKQNYKEVNNNKQKEILFYMEEKDNPKTMINIPVFIVDWIVFLSYIKKD